MKLRIVALPILTMFLTAACVNFGGVERELANIRIATVDALDQAIDDLQSESSSWQTILEEAQGKLTHEIQETVRTDIANLISHSIAQAGVEFRCNADFIGDRVRQLLVRIKAKFLGQPLPPIKPAICQVVPIAVDRSVVPDRVKQIAFYGYDFDEADDLKAFLRRTDGSLLDVTSNLDRPTHYAMTLKFGATGVQLDNTSERFILEWEGRQVSTIAVIQPVTPVCESDTARHPSDKVTWAPPRVRGDRDFGGHGPRVTVVISLLVEPHLLRASVYMRAKETKSDWTTAEGIKNFDLFRPDSGWRIDRVVGEMTATHSYLDGDHELDNFELGAGGPVKGLLYVGDMPGDEAGTRTQVEVTFNELRIEVTKTVDCVPDSAVRNLRDLRIIGPATLQRLEPGVIRELHRREPTRP